MNFDEKMQKTEKTGGNTGKFPAGSYLSEPIILEYIYFLLTLVLLIWPILGVLGHLCTIYGTDK